MEWWRAALRSQVVLQVADIASLEGEAPEAVALMRAQGVRSLLVVPLPTNRRHYGFMGLVTVNDEVAFTDVEVPAADALDEALRRARGGQ